MTNVPEKSLLSDVASWLDGEQSVRSAVLFGSSAITSPGAPISDDWSDYDLQIITSCPALIEQADWKTILPRQQSSLQIVRPATGGVRKVTALFAKGQLDLVLIPEQKARFGRLIMRWGLHQKIGPVREALNEIATCLMSGYRHLKGQRKWGAFYAQIVAEMPGVRLANCEACKLADIFLCDFLWVLQKLERGELIAAQHTLHRSLADTNLRLIREVRLRRHLSLPSFGLGRRLESLLAPSELKQVQTNSRLERRDLHDAAWRAFDGLKSLMAEMVPEWQVSPAMNELLASYGVSKAE